MTGLRKILHFAERADTSGFFPQLAKWHDRRRYEMIFGTLGTIDPVLREQMTGFGVRTLSLGCDHRIAYGSGLMRLAAFLRRERIDVVHTHLFDPSIVGLLAGLLARTPLRIVTRHYSDYHTRIDRPWHVRLDQLCTRASHAVIAVSEHTAEHLIEREAAPKDKVHVVLNGIDFDRVRPSADARTRLRAELGADVPVVLMMARLHPEKGHTHLFRALPELERRVRGGFVVWIAGAGSFESAYRAEVEALGCSEIVRFLGFRRDAADLMTAADVVVLPSVAEAFGLVLAEAIYLGKPVVASRVGGIPEIVDDGIDGMLVPPGDPLALVAALAGLLDDPERRRALSGTGAARVRQRFDFEAMLRRYEAIYEERLTACAAVDGDVQSLGDHHVA